MELVKNSNREGTYPPSKKKIGEVFNGIPFGNFLKNNIFDKNHHFSSLENVFWQRTFFNVPFYHTFDYLDS